MASMPYLPPREKAGQPSGTGTETEEVQNDLEIR